MGWWAPPCAMMLWNSNGGGWGGGGCAEGWDYGGGGSSMGFLCYGSIATGGCLMGGGNGLWDSYDLMDDGVDSM